jgi:hypothetical protein
MENRFNNRDFEQFVKQNADQYRMFPSDKVWSGIHNSLHTRRRWYGIGLAFLILTTGIVTWVMLNTSEKNKQVVSTLPININQHRPVEKKKDFDVVIVPAQTIKDKNTFIPSIDILKKKLNLIDKTTEPVIENSITTEDPLAIAKTSSEPAIQSNSIQKNNFAINPNTIVPSKQIAVNKPSGSHIKSGPVNDFSFTINGITTTDKEKIIITPAEKTEEKKEVNLLSNETAVNSNSKTKKRKKSFFQIFITPTISYRALKENKPFINSSAPLNSSGGAINNYYYTDINNIVTHKPDMGVQFGFTSGFPLSKSISLIGGLQFNISKYDIKAYSSPTEVTTFALSNDAGGTNTVSTLTNYRNSGGNKANWLRNLYFSASAPIGLEVKFKGNKKTYFGASGTVQPSYIISNRAYLISTDYKNYAEIPSLIRKWNVNTGFELFTGFNTGDIKWRVGPTVRYQTISSYKKQYPVEERLFDFGLKIGIMLNK